MGEGRGVIRLSLLLIAWVLVGALLALAVIAAAAMPAQARGRGVLVEGDSLAVQMHDELRQLVRVRDYDAQGGRLTVDGVDRLLATTWPTGPCSCHSEPLTGGWTRA
jgi:hypothetical protein